MKIGGHCVLFGPEVATDTTEVFGRLAYAGAQGCELGQRFFGTENREALENALAQTHMELAGMHANNLKLPDLLHAPEKAEKALMEVGELVAQLPNKNVIATGGLTDMEAIRSCTLAQGAVEAELHDPAAVRDMAQTLNEIVVRVRQKTGAQVHYHNHSWEFADDGLIFHTLAQEAPELCFALDTGWAMVSGFDPVKLMDSLPGRFHYVHLRDLKRSADPGQLVFTKAHEGFADLGTGDMNYPRLMRCLNRHLGENDWAIVEYEKGNFDKYSYAKAISYVRGCRDML